MPRRMRDLRGRLAAAGLALALLAGCAAGLASHDPGISGDVIVL